MLEAIKAGVGDWDDDDEVTAFLEKLIRREAGDRSGKIYGMGHAVYTLSDPRAVILRRHARDLAEKKGYGAEFRLLESVERLTPGVFARLKGNDKALCANVDMYSGLVYRSLGINPDLFTPLFAVARMPAGALTGSKSSSRAAGSSGRRINRCPSGSPISRWIREKTDRKDPFSSGAKYDMIIREGKAPLCLRMYCIRKMTGNRVYSCRDIIKTRPSSPPRWWPSSWRCAPGSRPTCWTGRMTSTV